MHAKILILDFGSQVTQLIARRIREAKVYSEIHPYDWAPELIQRLVEKEDCKGIILSGGPNSVTASGSPRAPQIVFELGVPVLGICDPKNTKVAEAAIASGANLVAAEAGILEQLPRLLDHVLALD